MVNCLQDVLSPDDQCVCVFTQQEGSQKNLVLNPDGISKSGIWKLDQIRIMWVNKVVVYYRHDGINEIITGHCEGISPTIFRDHYCIEFKVTNIDQTLNGWEDFCKEGTEPIQYYP